MKIQFKVSPKVKKIIYTILIFSITLPIAYFAFLHFKGAIGATPDQALGTEPQVNIITLKKQNVDNFEELPARITATEAAEVRPQVDGIILQALFTEGGKVEQGQQLYQIDPATYLAGYNSAKADLEKAKANLVAISAKDKRYQELIKIEAISKQEYDDNKASLLSARADVEVAKSGVEKAKISLNYTKVFSPISGYISRNLVNRGSLVSSGQAQPLATVTQLDPIFVEIQRPSEDLMQFKKQISGQEKVEVEVRLSDGSIYQHKGAFQFSEVNVDQSTSSVELRAIIDNPENILLPGSFVKARVKTSSIDAILIPQKVTSRSPEGNLIVWVLDDQNLAKPTVITAVKEVGNDWMIKDGVKEGDKIIVDGFQKIKPNSKVKPISAESAPVAAPAPAKS